MRIIDVLGATSTILAGFADDDYAMLVRLTQSTRFTASEIAERLVECGVGPVEPPLTWTQSRIEIQRLASERESWLVRIPLWSGGSPTNTVMTFSIGELANGLHQYILEDISLVEDFQHRPGAIPSTDIDDALAEYELRYQQSRQEPLTPVLPPAGYSGPRPADTAALTKIMALIVEGRFDDLDQLAEQGGMTGQQIREALADYGGRFVTPPGGLPPGAYVAEEDAEPWRMAEMFMWTAEGESDLCVYPELITHRNGTTGFRIYDIRVP